MAFKEVGIELEFRSKGDNEKGYIKKCNHPEYQLETGSEVIAVDPGYFRPTEVDQLVGDATKAREKLSWGPTYNLPTLIKEMVASDLDLMKKERFLKDGGYETLNYYE